MTFGCEDEIAKVEKKLPRRSFVCVAAAFGFTLCSDRKRAFAVSAAEKQAEADSVRNQLVGLNASLEAAAENYYQALDEQESARKAMETEQQKIDEATTRILELQKHLGIRARSMYRTGPSTFFDFVLGASSFDEFAQNWDLLNTLNESDAQAVSETKELRKAVESSKEEYAKQEAIAAGKAKEAASIKSECEDRISQANSLMDSLDAEARALLDEEQRAAAVAAAIQKQAEIDAKIEESQEVNDGPLPSPQPEYENNIDIPSQGSVVDYAISRIGCPYVWGAEGPDTFDCSGLVTWAYRQIGIELTHQSEAQYASAKQRVAVSEARPGDVLWRFGHVGIAVGYGGQPYVHAPNEGLLVRDTDSLSWSSFTCALRF